MKELKKRSAVKSVIWRIMGVLILGAVTYFYTRKWVTTSLITAIHHGTFLFVFYVHERIWLRFKKPVSLTARSLAKMFTYETLCGNIILGAITYLITGDWKVTSKVTITYISLKHIIFIFNELLWDKLKFGTRKELK